MLAIVRPLSPLFGSQTLLLLGNGLFLSLLSLRGKSEGFSTEQLGLILACYYLGMLLGARFSSHVIRRAGHVRSFAAFASLLSMSPILHLLSQQELFWAGLRLLDGFSLAGLFMIAESWLHSSVDNRHRGAVFAIYMVLNYLANGSAQLLLGVLTPTADSALLVSSVLFSAALLPLLLARSSPPSLENTAPLRILQLTRKAPIGFYGVFSAGLLNASFLSLGPVFAHSLGMNTEQIGLFMAAAIWGGLVLQIPLGRLSDRIERHSLLIVVCLGALSCCVLMMWLTNVPQNVAFFYPVVFIYGSLAFLVYSLACAHSNDRLPPDQRMQTSAALLTVFGFGAICGPVISSQLMARFGPVGLLWLLAAACLLLAICCFGHFLIAGTSASK